MPELSSRVCDLVGPSLNECGVTVVESSVARPQVEIVRPPREEESMEKAVSEVNEASESVMDHISIIVGGAVGAVVVCVGLLALCRYRSQKAKKQQSNATLKWRTSRKLRSTPRSFLRFKKTLRRMVI